VDSRAYRTAQEVEENHSLSPVENHETSEYRVADTTGLLFPYRKAIAPAATTPDQLNTLPRGAAMLVIKRGPAIGLRFLLQQSISTAGRHPRSDIYLDDVTVSRLHAEFRCNNAEFRIVDTNSLNGTYLNRQPVDSAALTHGDEIQIGNFRLLFFTATS
jgi:pSer/pThr/pTyr-binding forkhead associated (FHA) protein